MTALRLLTCVLATGLVIAVEVTPAAAHIQVRPTTAAPDDAVAWEVIVPNERDRLTTKVELAVPPGVIPFSYLEAPGWRRSLTKKKDGSVRSIVWRGSLRSDGFASFAFLASTPPNDGEIVWKAIQTYDDGKKVRWIEPAGGESPAAVTTVSKRFPPQNAGGEGPTSEAASPASTAVASTSDGDGSDSTARWLAAGALAAALAALALSVLRWRRGNG